MFLSSKVFVNQDAKTLEQISQFLKKGQFVTAPSFSLSDHIKDFPPVVGELSEDAEYRVDGEFGEGLYIKVEIDPKYQQNFDGLSFEVSPSIELNESQTPKRLVDVILHPKPYYLLES